MLEDTGFSVHPTITQLFIFTTPHGTTSLLSKIVDDILICGPPDHVDDVILKIEKHFTLGTLSHGPGTLRYFGLNILQYDDYSVSIDGNDKLDAIATLPITRVGRRELESLLNNAGSKAFASVNSSVG